jgi:hypothetical protein
MRGAVLSSLLVYPNAPRVLSRRIVLDGPAYDRPARAAYFGVAGFAAFGGAGAGFVAAAG